MTSTIGTDNSIQAQFLMEERLNLAKQKCTGTHFIIICDGQNKELKVEWRHFTPLIRQIEHCHTIFHIQNYNTRKNKILNEEVSSLISIFRNSHKKTAKRY